MLFDCKKCKLIFDTKKVHFDKWSSYECKICGDVHNLIPCPKCGEYVDDCCEKLNNIAAKTEKE